MKPILGHIATDTFLAEYWQKKPLVVRRAIDNIEQVIDAETLAGLSLESTVRSRIVQQSDQTNDWVCQFGPFDESDFERVPARNWTLLVQDVDKHLPDTAKLTELFSFLPRWRIDDLMISYAVDGGSVGPHTDQYDVFLLQAHGQRKWLLQTEDVDESNLVENIELQILEHFSPQQEYLLNPGDMLYLPPGIAHHGIAMGECITCSVGFRAPSQADLLQTFTEQFLLDSDKPEFYRDQDPGKTGRSELRHSDIKTMHQLIMRAVANESIMARAIGSLLTTPTETPSLYDTPPSMPSEFIELLEKTGKLQLHPATRCVYVRNPDTLTLYVNTNEYQFDSTAALFWMQLCDEYELGRSVIEPIVNDQNVTGLLYDLYQQGYLYLGN